MKISKVTKLFVATLIMCSFIGSMSVTANATDPVEQSVPVTITSTGSVTINVTVPVSGITFTINTDEIEPTDTVETTFKLKNSTKTNGGTVLPVKVSYGALATGTNTPEGFVTDISDVETDVASDTKNFAIKVADANGQEVVIGSGETKTSKLTTGNEVAWTATLYSSPAFKYNVPDDAETSLGFVISLY